MENKDRCCKDCSCLKCNMNGNKNKSCLSKETLEIINGCMGCYLCQEYPDDNYWYDKNKWCFKDNEKIMQMIKELKE